MLPLGTNFSFTYFRPFRRKISKCLRVLWVRYSYVKISKFQINCVKQRRKQKKSLFPCKFNELFKKSHKNHLTSSDRRPHAKDEPNPATNEKNSGNRNPPFKPIIYKSRAPLLENEGASYHPRAIVCFSNL